MDLIVFLLASYGVTNIVVSGKIFEPVRKALSPVPVLGYWIKCPMCFSVPVGVGWALLGVFPRGGVPMWVDLAAAGAIASGFCWMMRVLLYRLGEDEL